jgi:hypothetical protein
MRDVDGVKAAMETDPLIPSLFDRCARRSTLEPGFKDGWIVPGLALHLNKARWQLLP